MIRRLFIPGALAIAWLVPAAQDAPTVIVLRPARVFDGDTMHEGWAVRVRGERIDAVGPAASVASPGARTIELPGQTLMPGLIEGHSHVFLHAYNETPWTDQVLRESLGVRTARAVNHLKATLDAGFTTIRDLGTEGAADADAELKQAVEQGIIPGPRRIITTRAPQQTSVANALERYGRGEFEAAVADLTERTAYKEAEKRFRREAGEWLLAGPVQDRGSRLAIVSALGLEIVASTLARPRSDYSAVRPLVEWTCGLLRQVPPSEFERQFHLASIALLQGVRDEELLSNAFLYSDEPRSEHVRHAGSRFPEESRFKLAWATGRLEAQLIASWPITPAFLLADTFGRFRADPPGAASQLQETLDALGRLVDDEAVGLEARLRRGVLHFTMDQPEEAVADLRDAASSTDPFLRYLSHLMQGLVHERAGRPADAIPHFRAAWQIVPATSASLALSSALFRAGQGSEAAQVVASWSSAPQLDDPWRLYGQRDFRRFPQYLQQLRQMIIR
jgi:tetratricopeptide (TPR) repeat protein